MLFGHFGCSYYRDLFPQSPIWRMLSCVNPAGHAALHIADDTGFVLAPCRMSDSM